MLPPPSLPAEEAHPLSRSMSPAVATPEVCIPLKANQLIEIEAPISVYCF